MNLYQFLLILKARWKVVVGTLLGTVTTTLLLSLLLPAQYTASSSLVVDVKSPDPIVGMVLPALAMPGYMATQVDIINSDRVAIKVVKMLKLDQNPQVQSDWQDDTAGKGRIEVWLASLLQRKLDVKPSRESNVITINYKASDPNFAAAIANAFAQAYIDTNIELQVDPAKQYSVWFDKQAKELRERLAAAQARLSDYQLKHGIVVTDERLDSEAQKLNELQAQIAIAEGQSADTASKQRFGGGETLPEVMQSPLIQQLKSSIAINESKLQEMAGNLGRNHPQYKRAEAELVELKQQLAGETAKIAGSINASNRISRGKVSDLKATVEAQKARILDMRKRRDEAMVLVQEVEAAQKAYDAVTQRYTQSSLESHANQTNVSVLTPADPPIEPSFPKLLLNTILAVFLGTLLGIGAALLRELTNRRVRSREDIEQVLRLPVLAEFSAAQPRFFSRRRLSHA